MQATKRQSSIHQNSSNSGFTTVELLAGIAIVTILAAIIYPVFNKAKDSPRKAKCLSNQKQIGLGIAMYLADSEDFLPQAATHSNPTKLWSAEEVTGRYTKGPAIHRCPTAPGSLVDGNTYDVNREAFVDNGWIARDYPGSSYTPFVNPYSSIQNPANFVSTAEVGGRGTAHLSQYDRYGFISATDRGSDEISFYANHSNYPYKRHSSGCNVSFADSHVKSMKSIKLSQVTDPQLKPSW